MTSDFVILLITHVPLANSFRKIAGLNSVYLEFLPWLLLLSTFILYWQWHINVGIPLDLVSIYSQQVISVNLNVLKVICIHA